MKGVGAGCDHVQVVDDVAEGKIDRGHEFTGADVTLEAGRPRVEAEGRIHFVFIGDFRSGNGFLVARLENRGENDADGGEEDVERFHGYPMVT